MLFRLYSEVDIQFILYIQFYSAATESILSICNMVTYHTADTRVHSVINARTGSHMLFEPLYYNNRLLAA